MLSRISRLRRTEDGFTLIELVVVVAIIALLAVVALPSVVDTINKAKQASGPASVNEILTALDRYYVDRGKYPDFDPSTASDPAQRAAEDAKKLREELKPYLKNVSFRNPWKQSLLYVVSRDGAGYVLIDLQGDKPDDDDASLPGKNLELTCTNSSGSSATYYLTWTEGDAADLYMHKATFTKDNIHNCSLKSTVMANNANIRFINN